MNPDSEPARQASPSKNDRPRLRDRGKDAWSPLAPRQVVAVAAPQSGLLRAAAAHRVFWSEQVPFPTQRQAQVPKSAPAPGGDRRVAAAARQHLARLPQQYQQHRPPRQQLDVSAWRQARRSK